MSNYTILVSLLFSLSLFTFTCTVFITVLGEFVLVNKHLVHDLTEMGLLCFGYYNSFSTVMVICIIFVFLEVRDLIPYVRHKVAHKKRKGAYVNDEAREKNVRYFCFC
jgi:hypothetical protein